MPEQNEQERVPLLEEPEKMLINEILYIDPKDLASRYFVVQLCVGHLHQL